jgi:hemerythrin-like domain-containing protein
MAPLKRHPALQDFSRDHQRFLLHARNIRWLIDGDDRAQSLDDVVHNLLDFWETHGAPHLREEEEILYPLYVQQDPLAQEDIDTLHTDHTWLRDKFEELASLPRYENCAPILKSLEQYIINHVRHEERVIYEAIQQALDEETLTQLQRRSRTFREEHRTPDAIGPAGGTLPDIDAL